MEDRRPVTLHYDAPRGPSWVPWGWTRKRTLEYLEQELRMLLASHGWLLSPNPTRRTLWTAEGTYRYIISGIASPITDTPQPRTEVKI